MLVTRTRSVVTAGRIVEVEAYVGPHDPAAHGFGNRRSARNAQLFGRPGTAYVYFIYGMYWCVNAVTMAEDYPAAVLIRALEPLAGLGAMRRRRRTHDLHRLCSGPGKLCAALGITGTLNGARLDGRRVGIYPPEWWGEEAVPHRVVTTPRIGITKAANWPLRFVVAGSP